MAEAKGFFTGIGFIPKYCNGRFSFEYGNGSKDVTVNSDNSDLIDLMKTEKRNMEFLAEEEIKELDILVKGVKNITDSYEIEYQKIDGRGRNPAHFLCRKAEEKLIQN